MSSPLSSARVLALAEAAGFHLRGLARATPLPPDDLRSWLAAGLDADMDWMGARLAERLDPARVLPGAQTVISVACAYYTGDEPSPIARYARGRDYHATLRDRLRHLRRLLRSVSPDVETYACVDSGPVMEKVWAVKAGLGYVGRNGCLITPSRGSWVVLGAMLLDRAVDVYADAPRVDRCGKCRLCVDACPTDALLGDGRVDAHRCLSYQTIENEGPVPPGLRSALAMTVFGCDICQEVCPWNAPLPLTADARFAPRPVARLTARELAALTPADYATLIPGTPLARVQYDGLRRNAAYALGASRDGAAREVLALLARDDSERVREAAQWALAQLAAP